MRFYRTPQIFCALLLASAWPVVVPARAEAPADLAAVAAPTIDATTSAAFAVLDAPLPPEAAAFRAALRSEIADLSEGDRNAIEKFYAERQFEPYWTASGSDSVNVLIAALEQSPAHGLPFRRYDPGALTEIFAGDPAQTPPALREVAATRTYLRFGGDLGAGIVTPSRIDPEISISPERPSQIVLLAELNGAPLAEVLAGLEPPDPDYRALMAEKSRLEVLSLSDSWGPVVADGQTLHEGETDARIAALRARLARQGYGAPNGEVAGDTFDAPLAQAVQNFQRDHGLNDDGAVGQHTLAEINASPRDRLAQVVVNLERMRWLNQDFGPRYILVNIPDYKATVFEASAPVWSTKVVVGNAAKTRTPEFSDVMSYMVVNPTWNMPNSIAKRDYLPKLKRDPSVLARSGMQLMTPSGTVINPKLVDFTQLDGSFPFRIRQSPSDGNALGKVKFIFPNDFSIYMHDTPHRELFAKDARAFSNGCVRVENPDELAYLLLQGQVSDPKAAFQGWVAAKSERTVTLDRPIPVHIVYRSVFIDESGTPRYRDDIYGRDAEVFRALEAVGVTLPNAEG